MDKMKADLAKDEAQKLAASKWRLPFVTLLLGGASSAIYYKWQTWNNR